MQTVTMTLDEAIGGIGHMRNDRRNARDKTGCLVEAPGLKDQDVGNSGSAAADLLQVLHKLRDLLNAPAVTDALGEMTDAQRIPTGKPLLTEPVAADLLGIPADTLAELRRSGVLTRSTYIQQNGQVLYVREALLRYFHPATR